MLYIRNMYIYISIDCYLPILFRLISRYKYFISSLNIIFVGSGITDIILDLWLSKTEHMKSIKIHFNSR